MLAKIKKFIKDYQEDIILVIGVILISLLSFAVGYLVAKHQEKEPLRFEETSLFFQGMIFSMHFRSIAVRSMDITGSSI